MMDEWVRLVQSLEFRVRTVTLMSHFSATFSRPKIMDEATKEADEGQKARKRKVILMGKVLQVEEERGLHLDPPNLDTWTLGHLI